MTLVWRGIIMKQDFDNNKTGRSGRDRLSVNVHLVCILLLVYARGCRCARLSGYRRYLAVGDTLEFSASLEIPVGMAHALAVS